MSQESNYSVTVRTPKGNLVTVRADNALDWVANLNAAATSGALAVISQIEASLEGGNPTTQPASGGHQESQGQQSAQTATAGGQSSQSQGSLNPQCEQCGGSTIEKSGTSSRGPWRGYFCVNSTKENKHPVIWA